MSNYPINMIQHKGLWYVPSKMHIRNPAGPCPSSSFPTTAAATASIAGALVARSVGRQRRRLPKGRPSVTRKATTLDQLKEVTGKDGGIPLQLR